MLSGGEFKDQTDIINDQEVDLNDRQQESIIDNNAIDKPSTHLRQSEHDQQLT